MALVLMRDGRAAMLNSLLRTTSPPTNVVIRLYQDNRTPAAGDPNSPYILTEANYTGYARQSVAVWLPPIETANVAMASGFPVIFQCATPLLLGNFVYGYFASPAEDLGKVLWAERFDVTPLGMNVAGLTLLLYPSISEQSLYG